jgi:hypothetical protein
MAGQIAQLQDWLAQNPGLRGTKDYQYVEGKLAEMYQNGESEPAPVQEQPDPDAEQEEQPLSARLYDWMQDNKSKRGEDDYNYVQNRYLEALEKENPEGPPQPKTTIGGQIGGIVRGAGPGAMGAAVGLAGGPAAPITVPAGYMLGSLAKPVGDPLVGYLNQGLKKIGIDAQVATPSEGFKYLFDSLGIPVPDTEIERFTQTVAEGLGSTAGSIKLGQGLAKGTSELAKRVGPLLAEAPASQLATDTAANVAGQAAHEADLPPWLQAGVSLAAGAGTGVATAPRGAATSVARAAEESATTPSVARAGEEFAAEAGRRIDDAAEIPIIPEQATPAIPDAQKLTATQMGEASRSATSRLSPGREKMQRVLAEQAQPDLETAAAAKRINVEKDLQADHFTANQEFREYSQAVKSEVGSEQHAKEMAGIQRVSDRADEIVQEIGGTENLSGMSSGVKQKMASTVKEMETEADGLYTQIREKVKGDEPIEATEILNLVDSRAAKRKGGRMTTEEKKIKEILTPDPETGAMPTYTDLDDVRTYIGQAMKSGSGPFKDMDQGFLKLLYGKLTKDQEAAAKALGADELWSKAKASVKKRKDFEENMATIFGDRLDKSLTKQLKSGLKAAAEGDDSGITKLISSLPKEMRGEVLASGLYTMMRNKAGKDLISFKNFYTWHDGLMKNPKTYAAIMSELPQGAAQRLKDLSRVSKGISKALDERIHTGRLADFRMAVNGADTLAATLIDIAKNTAVRSTMELGTLVTTGIPGLGLSAAFGSAVASAARSQRNVMKAAASMIGSPEFQNLVLSLGTKGEAAASKAFLKSGRFKQLWNNAKNPQNVTPAQWLRTVTEAVKNREQEKEQ